VFVALVTPGRASTTSCSSATRYIVPALLCPVPKPHAASPAAWYTWYTWDLSVFIDLHNLRDKSQADSGRGTGFEYFDTGRITYCRVNYLTDFFLEKKNFLKKEGLSAAFASRVGQLPPPRPATAAAPRGPDTNAYAPTVAITTSSQKH
jgi:hypothetical protein